MVVLQKMGMNGVSVGDYGWAAMVLADRRREVPASGCCCRMPATNRKAGGALFAENGGPSLRILRKDPTSPHTLENMAKNHSGLTLLPTAAEVAMPLGIIVDVVDVVAINDIH